MATSNAAAERRLRLLAEQLISGAPDDPLAALADVEACALALAGAGVVDGGVAMGLVVSVVDALAVRGVAWLEPVAADLDVARLHEAVGSSRPSLRSVVPVGATLGGSGLVVTSVAVWDDRTEARVVAATDGVPAPAIVLDPVGAGDRRLDVRDGWGGTVRVELSRGLAGSVAEVVVTRLDADRFLAELEAWAAGEARRSADDVDVLNRLRRRLLVAAEALAEGSPPAARVDVVVARAAAEASPPPADRFDALVAALPPPSAPSASTLVEVVPLALRAGDRWLLAIERWSDHWRLAVAGHTGRGRWTATATGGVTFGGAPIDPAGVVRFDPALPPDWRDLRLTWTPDGSDEAHVVDITR